MTGNPEAHDWRPMIEVIRMQPDTQPLACQRCECWKRDFIRFADGAIYCADCVSELRSLGETHEKLTKGNECNSPD